MRRLSTVAAIACVGIIGIGLTGCGGGSGGSTGATGSTGSTGSTAGSTTTAKVGSADVNETTARTALAMVKNGGLASLAASSDKKMKLPDNVATRMAAKMKQLKISDTLLSKVKETGVASGNSGSVSQTYDCAVSGTMTLDSSWERNDAPEADERTETNKITFNDCIDTEEDLVDVIDAEYDTNNVTTLYHYRGAIGFTRHEQRSSIGEEESWAINAEHLSEEESTLAGARVWSSAMNGTLKWRRYETDSSEGLEISANGTAERKVYDANGTVIKDETYEADNFDAQWRVSDVQEMVVMDGYLNHAMKDKDPSYLYAEGFTLVYAAEGGNAGLTSDPAIVPEYSVDIEGVLGADCLGGSVTFSTPSVWLFDKQMPDIDPNDSNGSTPYSGTTAISGAGSSVATVEFTHNDVPEAYGTITVDGNTSDPMTLPQMTDGIDCDEELGWWF